MSDRYGAILVAVVLALSSDPAVAQSDSPKPKRDINAVLADHVKQFMSLTGIVGVYIGLLDDDRTTCIKVMLASDDFETRQRIPDNLEGYPVVVEIAGKVRPLGGAQ